MNIAASILFTFIIFFPPLALGASNIYFATVLQIVILALFYSYLFRSAKNGFFEYIKTPVNVFFAVFVIYILFQLLFGVTRYPYGTELSLINAAVFFMLFFSAAKFVDTPEKIDEVIFKITVSGFVVSVIGIMQALTKAGSIYWLIKPPHQNFFGTFINENSFACYTSMAALVTLGSIFSSMHSWERISGDMPVKRILVNTINNILDKKTLFEILAFSVMAYSVFISKSRSGMTFLAVSMLLFIVFMFRRHKTTIISAVMGLIAAYFLLSRFGIDVASNRLGSMLLPDSYVGRTVIYEAGLKLFGDYPVFGIGLGAFSNIFPMYNYGMEIFTFRHLHNDILQLLIESGFLGFSLIVIPLLLFFLAAVSKISRTANTYKYCVGLSILSAFFYLALHSLTDFQLRMNAISSLSVILLAALAFVAVFGEKKSVRRINILLPRTLSYALLSVLFMACLFIISRPLAAHVLSGSGRIGAVKFAMRLEPENGENYLQYARSVFNEAKSGRMPKKAAIKEAETALGKAIRINPYKTDYKISIARVYAMQYEYTKAFGMLQEAAMMEPNNSRVHLVYSYMLFRRAINESDPEYKAKLLKKGMAYYKRAGGLSKHTFLSSVIEDKMTYNVLKSSLRKENIIVE